MQRTIVILGNAAVGKTSLIDRFAKEQFNQAHNPTPFTGAFFKMETRNSRNEMIFLQIWDTAGQEVFNAMPPYCIRNADIALICFDSTLNDTRDSIYRWVQTVKNLKRNCIFYLIATKSDLLNNDFIEVDQFLNNTTEKENSPFSKCFLTSSKNGDGVELLLEAIADETTTSEMDVTITPKVIIKEEEKTKSKKGCC